MHYKLKTLAKIDSAKILSKFQQLANFLLTIFSDC